MSQSANDQTTAQRPRVLCVDDERDVLEGLSLQLRRECEVVLCDNPRKALQLLYEDGPYDVVLSDFRMPVMNGAEFLAEAKKQAPGVVRVLLSGQADFNDMLNVINAGGVYRYLQKPCPPDQLRAAIRESAQHARHVVSTRREFEQRVDSLTSQISRAERLASLGTMAGKVGHELGNVLTTFEATLWFIEQRAQENLAPDEADLAALRRVKDHFTRHSQHLLHLARPVAEQPALVDAGEVVSETLAMSRTLGVSKYVKVSYEPPTESYHLWIVRGHLEQIVLNLVRNAVDAVGDAKHELREVVVSVKRKGGTNRVLITVKDNGTGIAPDVLPRIFDPYFTTKGSERGNGLGLAVVRQIVEHYRGQINVETTRDVGTTFLVDFPLADHISAASMA